MAKEGESMKMERLTARSPKNNMAYLVKVKQNEQDVESPYPNTLRCIMEAFERLAQYEDTGCVVTEDNDINDGYHTFKELYHHRAILFSVICTVYYDLAWKSWKHADGTMFDDFFIVGVTTPKGNYTYHYKKSYWDLFYVRELEHAPEWDGHQPKDIDRLLSLITAQ
jgi:hypothetical protein